jgi:hypothetical protein
LRLHLHVQVRTFRTLHHIHAHRTFPAPHSLWPHTQHPISPSHTKWVLQP